MLIRAQQGGGQLTIQLCLVTSWSHSTRFEASRNWKGVTKLTMGGILLHLFVHPSLIQFQCMQHPAFTHKSLEMICNWYSLSSVSKKLEKKVMSFIVVSSFSLWERACHEIIERDLAASFASPPTLSAVQLHFSQCPFPNQIQFVLEKILTIKQFHES